MQILQIDGTHASGKTTLIHALTAHYRRQGINVAAMSEPARSSPFMEEIVNALAYARMLLDIEPATLDVAVLDVPLGYETDQRVEWIADRVADAGLILPG